MESQISSPVSSPTVRHKSVDWSSEADTDRLFRDNSIDQIRNREKSIRGDIERKKEELRQMVGERYRDLIDAADTIAAMQVSSSEVVKKLDDMKHYCYEIDALQANYNATNNSGDTVGVNGNVRIGKDSSTFYSIATQMKLLVDIPEKIWSTSDKKKFLDAALLYLLARQIVDNLQKSMTSSPVKNLLASFPILPRQWSTISHYVVSILQDIRERLKIVDLPEQDIGECLCAILLLDDQCKFPRQAFKDFLIVRNTLLETLLYSDEHTDSIKLQIRDVVSVIRLTICQIYKIFYVAETEDASKLRPRIFSSMSLISVEDIRESCQEWVTMITRAVVDGVSRLLAYVSSIKSLMAIRDAIWNLLTDELQGNDNYPDWDSICIEVLGRKLSIWDEFLKGLFFERAKTITQSMFDNAFNVAEEMITEGLLDLDGDQSMVCDHDMSTYIWQESSYDMPSANAWASSFETESVREETGGLTLKSRAFTPSVHRLCRKFDSKLRKILEDCKYYVQDAVSIRPTPLRTTSESLAYGITHSAALPLKDSKVGAFDKYAGSDEMKQFMKTTCEECIKNIADEINTKLDELQSSMNDETVSNVKRALLIDSVLWLGRIARAILEQCPKAKKLMTIDKDQENTAVKTKSLNKWSSTASKRSKSISLEVENEQRYHQLLTKTYHRAHKSILQNLVHRLSSGIYGIYEDHLTNEKIESERDLNVSSVLEEGVESFQTATPETKITQTCAIQFLYDIQFINNILNCQTDDITTSKESYKRAQDLVERIEGYIDPFDLDVFTPYIKSNLNRYTQRCMALLGCLTCISGQPPIITTDRTSHAAGQESHNVMPLSELSVRFSLLPYSTNAQRNSSNKNDIKKRSRKLSEPPSTGIAEAHGIPEATANLFKRVELLASYGIFDDDDTNTG
ncbi:uncharacterized protein TRIADDRAFT_54105 [Trichoplax adhaerens]|uniref:Conserved oligomeric Golgi complex subunit 1 n=1 Tax=Trichoplax adhaerens TaxID=10228 RepID=B3RR44_TRIAD|nr:hypothetical protein TRIADDRAFT_54105 [Trichoplax adhaerens]EDV26813.1 hypothetical protein TRIADDRAFT_54105 [Trichoplax adhaerens]|eukprot:XP_002110809.1 hypothetical protein TRIADDRAFT_54105 [Trichoplax adhaerens]